MPPDNDRAITKLLATMRVELRYIKRDVEQLLGLADRIVKIEKEFAVIKWKIAAISSFLGIACGILTSLVTKWLTF